MALDFLWPNLDQRPAIQILAEAWDKSIIDTTLELNDKYGAAGFYQIRQELEELGYGFVEQGSATSGYHSTGFVKTVNETGTFSEYPVNLGNNSNATKTVHGESTAVLDVAKDETTGKLSFSGLSKNGFKVFANGAATALNAVSAVATGCALGKFIDSSFYNAAPDYWDSIGMSTLNPETWNNITRGDNSFGAGLVNFLLGLNPTTGEAIGYLDENAFAYMAYLLKENGWFSPIIKPVEFTQGQTVRLQDVVDYGPLSEMAIKYFGTDSVGYWGNDHWYHERYKLSTAYPNDYTYVQIVGDGIYRLFLASDIADEVTISTEYDNNYLTVEPIFKLNGRNWTGPTISQYEPYVTATQALTQTYNVNTIYKGDYYVPNIGVGVSAAEIIQNIEGVTNQEGATLPDISDWNDIPSTLQSLQQQYPDMFADPLIQHAYDPDGTENITRYIPVPLPSSKSLTDTQPITGTATQTQPQQSPATSIDTMPQELLDYITKFAVPTTTVDPPETGEGDTPTPSPIMGSASALWSVYHPTQAQVDAFGAWLWGSPFLTNIGKLFSNPIEGVISLHKIFATPIDSGNGTIVVGTLDSGVGSATVDEQYVYVNCGNVDVMEQFGNVFDYPPFTEIYLYLPFIGIVPLDTNDVMRSNINVTYGVDVFTGACLAMVNVSRDGSTANMYQYAGCASVEYPLSNVQNSQLLAGILSAGAGIASIALSGGVSAPAVGAIVGGAASAAKSNVGKSGGFSGNSGAMGIKTPYLIIKRPQTKVANTFPYLEGYPTNYSTRLGDCSGHVIVKSVHVEGINATDNELSQIETLLKDGILI